MSKIDSFGRQFSGQALIIPSANHVTRTVDSATQHTWKYYKKASPKLAVGATTTTLLADVVITLDGTGEITAVDIIQA